MSAEDKRAQTTSTTQQVAKKPVSVTPPVRHDITYHGTSLTDTKQDGMQTYRKRSNSIRRLSREELARLRDTNPESLVGSSANRELRIRHEMEQVSQDQLKHGEERMRAQKPMTPHGVDAMRYAQSLSQEVMDEPVQSGDKEKRYGETVGKKNIPNMLGVAEVGGHIGVGFSGGGEGAQKDAQDLMGRVVALNEDYRGARQTGKLETLRQSTHFKTVKLPDVEPQVTTHDRIGQDGKPEVGEDGQTVTYQRTRVCAVHRATAAALAGAGVLPMDRPTHVDELPKDIGLMEVTHSSFSEKTAGNLKSHRDPKGLEFEALLPKGSGKKDEMSDYPHLSGSQRTRSNSISNLAKSCDGCMQEMAQVAQKRGGSSGHHH